MNKFTELTISNENFEEGSAIKLSGIMFDGQTSLRGRIKAVKQSKTLLPCLPQLLTEALLKTTSLARIHLHVTYDIL